MHTISILLPALMLAYDMICPDRSQRKLRDHGLCIMKNETKSVYTCLEDVHRPRLTFIESCSEDEDVVRRGKRYVINGWSTIGECSAKRYQPIPFYKSSGSMCILLKSTCHEVGQVVARNGLGFNDTSCICNYTKGYAYVTRPADVCNCVPSEEDCSCYEKPCPENQLLSADYECIHINATSVTTATIDKSKNNFTSITTTTMITDWAALNESPTTVKNANYAATVITVILILSGVIIGVLYFLINRDIEYFVTTIGPQTCTEGEECVFQCEVRDTSTDVKWFKGDMQIESLTDKYDVQCKGKERMLKVLNVNSKDAGEYIIKIKNCSRSALLTVQEIEMPTAIQYLSEEDKRLYMDIIKTGTEIRYYLRIVIIGENGVGKTCLLRRLLKQSTTGVQSTDGIEIHRCKIRLGNGEWIFEEVSDKKEFLTRIQMASRPSTTEDETLQLNDDNLISIGLQGNDDTLDTSLKSSASQTKTRQDILEDDHVKSVLERNANDQSTTAIPNLQHVSEMKLESESQPKQNITKSKLNMEEIIQGMDDLLNGINKMDVPAEKFVECRILDFAGQREYYATHPIFLNPNALHLLVANIMKDVKPIKAEDGFDKIAEYIDFWFDTIHSCGVEEEIMEKTNTEFLYPPTIIVCTRIDECRNQLQERKENFRKQLLNVLKNEAKRKHLRDICYVSNTDSDEEDFNVLRKTIFNYGKQVKTFAEKLPLRWIRLEQSLDVLRQLKINILSWQNIVELSSKLSIDSEDEINLFLKYQHKIGGVIYFESLKEYIILNQKWLANAFKCLVSDKFESNLKLSYEWIALENTGKLEHSLIVKLFDKEPELDFNKHSVHILKVMEIFGIIVKLTTLMENGQRKILPTYYMPCMISEKASLSDIIDMFNAKNDDCKRTPWLCIEFDFMPLDFFNHILCHYISKYAMCTEPQTGRMTIYHGMGVFFLDGNKFRKFILCFCKNTIALQIWQWKNVEKGKCKTMLEELGGAIERVKERFETRRVSYTVKSKCSDGNIHMPAGCHSYSELLDLGEDYFCEEHNGVHKTEDLFQTWFEDYTEKHYVPAEKKLKGQEGIQDSRFKQKCHVCDKEPSVYWCYGCRRSMCQDCNNQHMESTDTKYHIVQHVQDMYSLDYNFKVNVGIRDIKVLHDDVLVIADNSGNQLVTCDITGQQQHTIPLPGRPWHIAVVDNNTVAVTLPTTVVIVDVRQRQVIQHIDVEVMCWGIMYRDNQLFVGCYDRTIKVMNMSGEVTRAIPVGVGPYYICGGEAGRIYYTDHDKLYCIDTVGNTLFTFTDPNMSTPVGITTDDEGHVLVICEGSNNVLRISPDGKQSQVIITQIPSFVLYPYICYNSLSKSVVIGRLDNVYVYKKV